MENSNEKLALFHIGRGGHFNKKGYLRCKGLIDSYNAEYYGIDVYFNFENMTSSINKKLTDKGFDIVDLAYNWDDYKEDFDNEKIKDEDGNVMTWEDLGDPVVNDNTGNEMCTLDDYLSNNGRLDVDGDYDTYFWMPISEVKEENLEIIIRDLSPYEYKDELIADGVDANVFEILEKTDKLKAWSTFLYESFENFKKLDEVLEFETEEDADNEGYYTSVEIYGQFYAIE